MGPWCPCSALNLYTPEDKQVLSFHAKHLVFSDWNDVYHFHGDSHRFLSASNFKTQPHTCHLSVCLSHCLCVYVCTHLPMCLYVCVSARSCVCVYMSRQLLVLAFTFHLCEIQGSDLHPQLHDAGSSGCESCRTLISTSHLTQRVLKFHMHVPGPNSGPHTCTVCTLLTESSLYL